MDRSSIRGADCAAPLHHAPWWDLATLLRLRALVASLDPSAAPTMSRIVPPGSDTPRRLGLLAGSFNPVTLAHVELARSTLQSGRCDAVWFLMSVRTVDKEVVTGALLEDRLAVLGRVVADVDPAHLGVALCNRGLYVDQADAAARLASPPDHVVMIVGFDKIVQIFDPRYYEDRDAALVRLFDRASFVVADRAGSGASDLAALLARPENRRFAACVAALEQTPSRDISHLSSTRVREAVADSSRGFERDVPEAVARFVRETGAYETSQVPSDRYALRAALIAALATLGEEAMDIDLRRLVDEVGEQRSGAASVREALLTLPSVQAGHLVDAWLERHRASGRPEPA